MRRKDRHCFYWNTGRCHQTNIIESGEGRLGRMSQVERVFFAIYVAAHYTGLQEAGGSAKHLSTLKPTLRCSSCIASERARARWTGPSFNKKPGRTKLKNDGTRSYGITYGGGRS